MYARAASFELDPDLMAAARADAPRVAGVGVGPGCAVPAGDLDVAGSTIGGLWDVAPCDVDGFAGVFGEVFSDGVLAMGGRRSFDLVPGVEGGQPEVGQVAANG